MADYVTQLSCTFDVESVENVARALELYRQDTAAGEHDTVFADGFHLASGEADADTELCIHADDYGDPECVIRFVRLCASAFGLSGRWGFQWANTCSRLRVDDFGGSAVALDLATGEVIAWINTHEWLANLLAGGDADV